MPRKIINHPFQFELLRQQKDKERIERELKLRQNIYAFAKLSDKVTTVSWTVIPVSTSKLLTKPVFLTKRRTFRNP
jgi:hypothetical protein